MNVILLDFDGVINTVHNNTDEKIEERVKILSKIVNEANSKIVIEASMKDVIDEDTLETDSEWINNLFDLFKKI